MVRMQIRGGIRWPKDIDFRYIPTPGRQSWGDLKRIIRLAKKGCANRPFYHIEVTKVYRFSIQLVNIGKFVLCIVLLNNRILVTLRESLKEYKQSYAHS